jgi:hypothetical protein
VRDGFVQKTIEEGRFGEIIADILFAIPEGYLTTADRTFKLGMDEAASLVCRGSMEAAMYTFLYVEPIIGSQDITLLRPSGPRAKITYEKLYNKVAGAKVAGTNLLSSSEREALRRIGEHGNAVAHVIDRFTRHVLSKVDLSGGVDDFPFPARTDVEKDILEARPILVKFRGRVAERIQAEAAASLRKSPA